MELDDLKIIDELLLDYKYYMKFKTFRELEEYSNLTNYAMNRLRQAYKSGEMKLITLSLAKYFRNEIQ